MTTMPLEEYSHDYDASLRNIAMATISLRGMELWLRRSIAEYSHDYDAFEGI